MHTHDDSNEGVELGRILSSCGPSMLCGRAAEHDLPLFWYHFRQLLCLPRHPAAVEEVAFTSTSPNANASNFLDWSSLPKLYCLVKDGA